MFQEIKILFVQSNTFHSKKMHKRFLTMSMPINGIFNTRQQQQVRKQRHLKTFNHLWDSGHVLSFMTSAIVQMTGMANRVDDLAPCPLPHNTTIVSRSLSCWSDGPATGTVSSIVGHILRASVGVFPLRSSIRMSVDDKAFT